MTAPAWQPIETAPKDGTVILALMRATLSDVPSQRWAAWEGRMVCLYHQGVTRNGTDLGWSVAAPVGVGGLPDEWIAHWMPLPEPPQ